ncbi:MAG: hypothetical protein IPQ24_07950 [Anaeromyxobacter sp.]|nr:hypothetical protein [Anaeromyxobacter sp.]
MDPTELAPIAALFPKVTPYLAAVPVVQLMAKLLAPLPGRVGGFSHATWWSRFWDTVAAFPAAPAPRASRPAEPPAP